MSTILEQLKETLSQVRGVNEVGEPRVIDTGLQGPVNLTIISSILGQLSDGRWENTPGMEKFWKGLDVQEKGNQVILVLDPTNSGFRGKDDASVRKWFADRLKSLVYYELDLTQKGQTWSRSDSTQLDYLNNSKEHPVTVADAYKAYDTLKGRN